MLSGNFKGITENSVEDLQSEIPLSQSVPPNNRPFIESHRLVDIISPIKLNQTNDYKNYESVARHS